MFGVSGAGAAGHGHAEDIALRAWKGLGLPGTPHVGDDITVAFAAGSAAGDGVVLISGTGAVAARLYGGEVVRRCDGYGWWLGDEGSAVWLATEGVRAALAALDGRGRPTVLVDLIAAALGVARGRPQAIIGAVYQIAPAELGRLAPEVSEAARAGDEVAAAITASAAERLLAGFAAVAPEIEPGPVVLSGAVLATGPVADLVREGLTRRFGITAVGAAPGEFGAAGLALRRNGQSILAHARLIDGVR
ncbi:hypothetical protein Nans01_20570 [Nocardiopsis ansamitocini]|uniref:ATPase BadF/BadG/BcrA/BcrD type domain-containing protein n=1 Tax=Nocardiopsis ansamitocini TaxID=1670832 RepID=A0A9W6P614_9ACTN|nr:hypothetical protein Nans01_20570 [Nocardiopsis ansamitocini]